MACGFKSRPEHNPESIVDLVDILGYYKGTLLDSLSQVLVR